MNYCKCDSDDVIYVGYLVLFTDNSQSHSVVGRCIELVLTGGPSRWTSTLGPPWMKVATPCYPIQRFIIFSLKQIQIGVCETCSNTPTWTSVDFVANVKAKRQGQRRLRHVLINCLEATRMCTAKNDSPKHKWLTHADTRRIHKVLINHRSLFKVVNILWHSPYHSHHARSQAHLNLSSELVSTTIHQTLLCLLVDIMVSYRTFHWTNAMILD